MNAAKNDTIVGRFGDQCAAQPDRPALHFKRGGKFQTLSWAELRAEVHKVVALLMQLGVEPGDHVAQFSPNRMEWILLDLAIQMAGGVHVPIHNALAGPQVTYQIVDSGAKALFLAGDEQAAKIRDEVQKFPAGIKLLSYDKLSDPLADQQISMLSELAGQFSPRDAEPRIATSLKQLGPASLATILYTSGTTGEPKGVMLTQGNLASNSLATVQAFGQHPDDIRLNWLPLSHIFARTCDLYTWITSGGQLALAESPDTVLANCAEVRPTLMNSVPYFWEKVHRVLQDNGKANETGVLASVFGGRLRAGCSGGAPLPDHVAEYYLKNNVILTQGYGLTESSPVISFCTEENNKLGTVGPPIPGVEVKIAQDGEILTKGPHVMVGYWKKPAATAEALKDGWLFTGDIGEIDAEGYLKITGRKKELIVTSGGKNIAPNYLEGLLIADPLIEQAMVIGDRRIFLTALIYPGKVGLASELAAKGISLDQLADPGNDPRVLELYRERIDARLAGVSDTEQIGKFTLIDRPFSVELGELTPTLKLRRSIIAEHFSNAINAMYAKEPARARSDSAAG